MHRSASGVDLPMKVADMFGAGLPVCALNYGPCLAERIEHGHNGLLFGSAEELAAQWLELFRGFPQPTPLLERIRRGALTSSSLRWCDNWREQTAPVFFGVERTRR
jgi:beta-1,4-mannosyltransferase